MNYIEIGERTYYPAYSFADIQRICEQAYPEHAKYFLVHISSPREYPCLASIVVEDISQGWDYQEQYLYRSDIEDLIADLQQLL